MFAIRPEEKVYLEEYAVKKVIRRPDGGKEFVIVEIGRERPFFEDWAVLGPLPYPGSSDITSIPGAFTVRPGDSFAGANGEISWARPRERPALGHVSLIDLFQEDHRRDLLRDVCARATTYFRLPPGVREPVLELFSSNDWISVALNGEVVMGPMETKSHELYRAPVTPRNGWNELGIATCHDRRGWFFGARVSDGGKTVEGIETRSGL